MLEIILVILVILVVLYFLSDNSKKTGNIFEQIKCKDMNIKTKDPIRDYIYARQWYLLNENNLTQQDLDDLNIEVVQ
jgi:hypothetical protein